MTRHKVIFAALGACGLAIMVGCGADPARDRPPDVRPAATDIGSSPTAAPSSAAPPPAAPPPAVATTAAKPPPPPPPPPVKTSSKPPAPTNDPRYGTCAEAKSHGYGPYYKGKDPEYYWYIDRDKDGIVCE